MSAEFEGNSTSHATCLRDALRLLGKPVHDDEAFMRDLSCCNLDVECRLDSFMPAKTISACDSPTYVGPDEGSDFLGGPVYTITCDAVPQPQGATLSWDAGCDFLGGPIGSAVESRLLWPGELPTCNMISESHDCLARSFSATCGPDAAGELCELPLGKNSHTQPGIGTREPRKKDKQPGTGAPEPEKTDKRARAPSAAECAAIADAAALLTGPSLGPRSSWSIARCAMEQRCLGRSLSEAVPYAQQGGAANKGGDTATARARDGFLGSWFSLGSFLKCLDPSSSSLRVPSAVCHDPNTGVRIGEASNPDLSPCLSGLGLSLSGLGAGFPCALCDVRWVAMPRPVST